MRLGHKESSEREGQEYVSVVTKVRLEDVQCHLIHEQSEVYLGVIQADWI